MDSDPRERSGRDRACVVCVDNHDLRAHHIIPLAESGHNHLDNLEL